MSRNRTCPDRSSLLALAAALACLAMCPAYAVDPKDPYPDVGTGTSFLDKNALLGQLDEPDWYRTNIPFVDLPDQQIRDVYYYRWKLYKEHLVYTGPTYGWYVSEFIDPQFWAAPWGALSASAGHQINEGKWLRNQQYMDDEINFWLNGPGASPKPQNFDYGTTTTDWAHEYSFWAASAIYNRFLINGDRNFVVSQLQRLQRQWDGWSAQYNPDVGLYWQTPVFDATEWSAASYQSPDGDAYHGDPGYRPSINAYQYGDAKAIANIATLAGDAATAATYNSRASGLKSATDRVLWDPARNFYYHVHRDGNPNLARLDTREHIGFLPWMFDMPDADKSAAWSQIVDPDGFDSTFGPPTAERRSPWFMHDAAVACCRWDGPSWPYATSQVLTAFANLLQDYPPQSYVNSGNYVDLLRKYALTQFRNGVPYVAEAHDPDAAVWMYDAYAHSEDYNHSTFNDNVLTGLFGIKGQSNNTVAIKPLAPPSWDYFVAENVPYHGHNLTVMWDRTGARYNSGAGLHVYVDGALAASQAGLQPLTVKVPKPTSQFTQGGRIDIAVNSLHYNNPATAAYQPVTAANTTAFASFTSASGGDDMWKAIDGRIHAQGLPINSRWTSYGSSNASDYMGVNFNRSVTIDDVRLDWYDDAGGVRVPTSYDLQYWKGGSWASVPGQVRGPTVANATTRITFPPITTGQLRVVAPNRGGGVGWGLHELEVWQKIPTYDSGATFRIVNRNAGKDLSIDGGSTADGANAILHDAVGTTDQQWHVVETTRGYYRIVNVRSGEALSLAGGATAQGTPVHQWPYFNGQYPDQEWTIQPSARGYVSIVNKQANRALSAVGAGTANGTPIHVWDYLGTAPDEDWTIVPVGTAPR